MSDFINEEEVCIEVLGRPFKFRELTGVEKDEMTDRATSINSSGEISYKVSEQNKGYLRAVTSAPYPEWTDLKGPDERLAFLNKLKDPIRIGLINQIRDYHMDLGDDLKN